MQSSKENRRYRAIVWVAVALLALVAFRTEAIAQVARAVLMKSADEPGRAPYMSSLTSATRCEGFGLTPHFRFEPRVRISRMLVRINIHSGLKAAKTPAEDSTQWVTNKT
ncbi:MAG: hypothetical protein FJW30_28550, partial [Acidobacteria bacterium]|nr:hypothetical protein [Acidobacteriota bacterium]